MFSLSKKRVALGTLMAAAGSSTTLAFQAPKTHLPAARSSSLNMVGAVDPTTVTKKDYEDICGVSFDDATMRDRLKSTKFLYPKHVEVIEDIAPIAGEMVDSIVRCFCRVAWRCVRCLL